MAEGRVNENPPEYSPQDDEKTSLGPIIQQRSPTTYQQPPTYQQSPTYPSQPAYQQNLIPGGNVNYVMASQPATTITVVTPNFGIVVGDFPVQVICPNCQSSVVTSIKREVGGFCWFVFAMLCLFGCFLCAWIPFVVDSCHDAVHTCPRCNAVIGRYRRM